MSWFGWSDVWIGIVEYGLTLRRLMSQIKSNWFRNWKTQLNIPFDMYPTLPK